MEMFPERTMEDSSACLMSTQCVDARCGLSFKQGTHLVHVRQSAIFDLLEDGRRHKLSNDVLFPAKSHPVLPLMPRLHNEVKQQKASHPV